MSLVEKTLKRLQEGKAAAAAAAGAAATAVAPGARVDSAALLIEPPVIHRNLRVGRDVLRATGLLPPEHQERQLADQYRQIKRPLVAAALATERLPGSNNHLVMVSSALPGDGKTFTAINLALSIGQEKDATALLIDADSAKPQISTVFGVENEPGLFDALQDETIDIESLIFDTDLPGLSILPAGRRSESAVELIASQRMQQIAAKLERRNPARIAVIDSSPLLLTNEPRELAKIAGQVVMVVAAGRTPHRDVLEAISYLDLRRPVGLVLNQSLTAGSGTYYGEGVRASSV